MSMIGPKIAETAGRLIAHKKDTIANTAAQTGRIASGAAKGTTKAIMALPMLREGIDKATGRDQTRSIVQQHQPPSAATRDAITAIDARTDSILSAPQSGAAQFWADASNAIGEMLPTIATSAATGGGSLVGTGVSQAVGGAIAYSSEYIESGELYPSLVAAGAEVISEKIGGKLFNGPADKMADSITNKAASGAVKWSANALGEGAEEVISGGLQALLTGKPYGLDQASREFALGATVGGVVGGVEVGANAINKEIITQKTIRDVQSGKGYGAIEGLNKSLEIAQASPEIFGETARALAQPAQESSFQPARLDEYVRSAITNQAASGMADVVYRLEGLESRTSPEAKAIRSTIDDVIAREWGGQVTHKNIKSVKNDVISALSERGLAGDDTRFGARLVMGDLPISQVVVPKNISEITARNVGSYETLTGSGLKQSASVLEAAQKKGLSPKQSGRILKAVVETNSDMYTKLGQIEGTSSPITDTVQINRAADYRDVLPESDKFGNYAALDMPGRKAQTVEGDRAINVFRGMTSEWVLPTLKGGEFVVANPAAAPNPSEVDSSVLFGSAPGQMLGAGLYLTAMPSKADQYTSGAKNEISMVGKDSGGIMAHSPIFGATTFINADALEAAEHGEINDTVRRGRAGEGAEPKLANFMNASHGNTEAAIVYSKQGDDYTEIVRPDANKTQIERLYMPKNTVSRNGAGAVEQTTQETAPNTKLESKTPTAAEYGQARATVASEEVAKTASNTEVSPLLERLFAENPSINLDAVIADASGGNEKAESTLLPIDANAKTTTESVLAELRAARENEVKRVSDTETSLDLKENAVRSEATKLPEHTETLSEKTESTKESSDTSPEISAREEATGDVAETEKAESERASEEIWRPEESSRNYFDPNSSNTRKRENKERQSNDFSIVKGPGSRGAIHETAGYNTTFGGLSSY